MSHVRCRDWLALMALAGSALAGCSKSPTQPPDTAAPPAAAAPPFAKSATNEFTRSDDPCNLLEPKEVEAVLGTLALPPYRAVNGPAMPVPSGDTCVYETDNYRYITFQVVREGGSKVYSMSGMVRNLMKNGAGDADLQKEVRKTLKLEDGSEVTGEWDEASLMPLNCCIFQALRGDALITIDFTASAASLRQAADLVDAAYRRFDHPLAIDGGAAVAAAKSFDKTRPQRIDACRLLTRAEVEAILGPLPKQPTASGQDGCNYEIAPLQQYELVLRWRGGYHDWRSDRHVHGVGIAFTNQAAVDQARKMGMNLPEDTRLLADPTQQSASGTAASAASAGRSAGSDPAESVSDDGLHFVAVKRDVEVKVNDRMNDPDKAKALVAAALAKL